MPRSLLPILHVHVIFKSSTKAILLLHITPKSSLKDSKIKPSCTRDYRSIHLAWRTSRFAPATRRSSSMATLVTFRDAVFAVLPILILTLLASPISCYGHLRSVSLRNHTTSRYTTTLARAAGRWYSGGATWYGSPYGAGSDGKYITRYSTLTLINDYYVAQ